MFASWTLESSSMNRSSPPPALSPRALTMNVAHCARVVLSFGQNWSLSGGLQPRVMPTSATALMLPSKIEVSSSVKKSSELDSRLSARWKNAAPCPLVSSSVGQNSSLSGGLQPTVIPAAAMISMLASWTLPLSSTNRAPAAPRCRPSTVPRISPAGLTTVCTFT
jgi:hypothetical protein